MSSGGTVDMKKTAFRECKKSAASYHSRQGFKKDLTRRRDSLRMMIEDVEKQAIVLKSAESALSAQLEKLSEEDVEKKEKK